VGDSRAVISMSRGKITSSVTVDHKPSNATERQRVVANGGQVYQNKVASPHKTSEAVGIGPLRIFPGGLSVRL
jgi:serine/threonine protein phosphatase PrpC